MASSIEFVEYVCTQISETGDIFCRKMMGDYCVYLNGKVIGDICDNQFLIKPTKAGLALLPKATLVPPYNGAKPYILIDDLENTEFLTRLVLETWRELPAPKNR